MAIDCVTTPYGPPAQRALAAAVAEAKAGDPLAPVTVVVPTNYVGLAARRALGRSASGGRTGVAAVDFVTVYGLAERLGGAALADEGRPGVSTAVVSAAVRSVLRDSPGYFAAVAEHPATESALAAAHRELSELDDSQLGALAAQSPRACDVVRIHRHILSALKPRFSNEQELVAAAAAAAENDPQATRRRLGRVVVFLPQRLTGSQARLLKAVAGAVDTLLIAGLTGAGDADAAVAASLERLGLSLADAPASGAGTGAARLPQIKALSVSDADEEARHAVREVVAAAGRGTPLGRCAIVYGSHEPYARLVCDALDAAEIERCGATARTAATSWLGRSLLDLLELRHEMQQPRGASHSALMSWLGTAQVLVRADALSRGHGGDGDNDGGSYGKRDARWRAAPVAAWERVARDARVAGTFGDWRSRLAVYVEDRRADAERLGGDEDRDWLRSRLARDADRAEDLSGFVRRLDGDLNPEAALRTWRATAAWCRRLVREYLGGRRRRAWPDDERLLAEKVDAAVERLGGLDGIDDRVSPARFRQALQLELESAGHHYGRFGAGVLVGSVEQALGGDFDFVAVCGMAEGVFPARRSESTLLPDRERRRAGDCLPPSGDRSADDHRALLAVLAAASRSLLLYPRGDLRRAAEHPPSRWLLDVVEARDGARPRAGELDSATGEWLHEVPSFTAGLRRATSFPDNCSEHPAADERNSFPATEQEYDTRAALDWHDAHGAPTNRAAGRTLLCSGVFAGRDELRRGAELRLGRQSDRFTRFDGNLVAGDLRGAPLPGPADPEAVVSASRLEAWATCPHAYFVRHLLGVDRIDDDADTYRISPLDRGSLVHGILERWVSEAIDAAQQPAHGEPWSGAQRERLLEIGEEECDRLQDRGLVGRRLYWHSDRRRVLADLARFVEFDNEMRAGHGSVPVAAELGFGMPGSEAGPVEVRLGSGKTIRIRGSIDRLDETRDGELVVIDYKTGSIRRYDDLSADNPTPDGGHLQIVLYALAARALRGEAEGGAGDYGAYWFVSSRSSRSGKLQARGYAVADARQRVLQTVDEIVAGIGGGVFPLHPEEPRWGGWIACHFCEPDGAGTRDQRRDWQRKRGDPALRGYLELVSASEAQS